MKTAISFEFFPPKTTEGMQKLLNTATDLASCEPEFFSVTYGAGGSTRQTTLEAIQQLKSRLTTVITPHLSCIGLKRDEIQEILAHYKSLGMRHLVALRGDLPSGMGQAGELNYASELVALIREVTGNYFHITVAAYPEIHPQAKTTLDDLLNLKRKQDAGANSAITQYFFNPDAYFYYRDECARAGIHLSITPGIMPIMQFTKLARFSEMCGAEIPLWISKRLAAYGDDLESIQKFGLEVVYQLCDKLLMNEAPGLHFYTLNHAEPSLKIIELLGLNPAPAIKKINKQRFSITS